MKPSVTQLISLLDKPWLLKWANKIWLEWIKLEEYQKKSTNDWISLHKQIENKIRDWTTLENPIHEKRYNELFRNNPKLISEENIETEYFVWRIDLIIEWKEKYICDFKSSWSVYFAQKLQLAAYRMAKPWYKTWIIQIPEFIFKNIEIEQNEYEKIIIALYQIWTVKNNLNIKF